MATFYSRLQAYRQRPDAIAFSKKKLKKLHNYLARLYDSRVTNPPVEYVRSEEGDFLVRNYPEAYTRTIDGLLYRLHNTLAPQKPKRPRKPLQRKPVYSKR